MGALAGFVRHGLRRRRQRTGCSADHDWGEPGGLLHGEASGSVQGRETPYRSARLLRTLGGEPSGAEAALARDTGRGGGWRRG